MIADTALVKWSKQQYYTRIKEETIPSIGHT